MYKTLKPVYPSANFQVWPVYFLTFAYSNGHSITALVVADANDPRIILSSIPPDNGS